MFHLINSIYTDLTQKPRFNILCVGSGESGKTTLLQTIKGHYVESKPLPSTSSSSSDLPRTRPTVGQNVFDIQSPLPSPRPLILPAYPPPEVDTTAASPSSSWFASPTRRKSYGPTTSRQPSKAVLHVWDLGGEKGLRSIWKEYFNEADCVVYFWDCGSASRGEAREEEWEVLASLAQEPQLAHLPFLVLLSRSDLTARSVEKGKAKAAEADDSQATATRKSSMEDDEDGDLSLSVSESTDSLRDISAHPSQRPSLALSSRPSSPPSPSIPPETPTRPQVTPPEDSDVLDSLRMFIVSHIEAYDHRGEHEDAHEDGDGEEETGEAVTDDAGDDSVPPPPLPFPETTILPISSLTGKGIVECMDWFVHKSLASTRRV